MKKCLFSLFLCIVFMFTSCISCFAKMPTVDAPLWENIFKVNLNLVCSENTGHARGTLQKQPGVTSAEGTITIYKKNGNDWIYVDSLYKETSNMLVIDINFIAKRGVQYKAVFDVTAYRGDVGESRSVTEYKTCS